MGRRCAWACPTTRPGTRCARPSPSLELLSRRTGGKGGGGSALTVNGAELVRRFREFLADSDAALDRLYSEHFGDMPFAQPEPPATEGEDSTG